MPEDLKMMRNKKGYTQAELAKLTGFSQSLIARIESGKVNPRMSTIQKILSVLSIHSDKAVDISKKEAIIIYHNKSVGNAIEIMENNYISQIPVRDKATKKFLGVISEKLIMSYITDRGPSSVNDKISKMQLEKLEIISSDLQLPEIEHLLQNTSVLLVRLRKEKFGIITKSDLLQYYKN